MKLLVVEDDAETADYVAQGLRELGHGVDVAANGRDGLFLATDGAYDLLVVDRMLPGLDGLALVKTLRGARIQTPVLFLTTLGGIDDRVEGLEAGGDDYLVKPFSPRELAVRVEAVLRRAGRSGPTAVESFGGGRLVIDEDTREVTVDGRKLTLTRSEFDLLSVLSRRPGRVWSRYELVTRIQGYEHEGCERVVDAHVKNLRRKLGDPPVISTTPGVGYRIVS